MSETAKCWCGHNVGSHDHAVGYCRAKKAKRNPCGCRAFHQQPAPSGNGVPRRNRVDLWTPAERAIAAAVHSVEVVGAHPLLTDAVILLGKARDKVADYVERQSPSSRAPSAERSQSDA